MSKLILFVLGILLITLIPGVIFASKPFLSSGAYVVTFESTPKINVVYLDRSGESRSNRSLVLHCEDAQLLSEHVEQEISDWCSVLVKNDVQRRGSSEIQINTLNDMYYPIWYLLDSAEGNVSIVIEFKNQQVLKRLKDANKSLLYYS